MNAAIFTAVEIDILQVLIGTSHETHVHAIVDGKIIGRVSLRHGKLTSYFSMLFVHPNHRGKGIGKCLVAECERLARENHRLSVNLLVNKGNDVAAFYHRLGYFPAYEWDDGDVIWSKRLEAV